MDVSAGEFLDGQRLPGIGRQEAKNGVDRAAEIGMADAVIAMENAPIDMSGEVRSDIGKALFGFPFRLAPGFRRFRPSQLLLKAALVRPVAHEAEPPTSEEHTPELQ